MSNRPGHLTIAERIDVARMVCALREDRKPWKLIEDRFGLSSHQLRRYIGLMQQQNRLMQHHGSCDRAGAAAGRTEPLCQ